MLPQLEATFFDLENPSQLIKAMPPRVLVCCFFSRTPEFTSHTLHTNYLRLYPSLTVEQMNYWYNFSLCKSIQLPLLACLFSNQCKVMKNKQLFYANWKQNYAIQTSKYFSN